MKASCLRRRHSRRTAAQHVTYSDPFPLAQWQRPSSRDSCLVAKPVPPPTAALHPGARGGGKAREEWWRSFMDTFGPGEGAYATAALFIALARKLIDKEI